jgi:hypothetical protein
MKCTNTEDSCRLPVDIKPKNRATCLPGLGGLVSAKVDITADSISASSAIQNVSSIFAALDYVIFSDHGDMRLMICGW